MQTTFLHISDLHYARQYEGKGGWLNPILQEMDDPLQQLQNLVNENPVKPDFLLLTGDICEDGSAEDYSYVEKRLTMMFHVPMISTPGNHDNKEYYYKGFLKQKQSDSGLNDTLCHGIRILSVDSSDIAHQDGLITEETVHELQLALNSHCEVPTILITHHHLIPDQVSIAACAYPAAFMETLQNSNILAVLNGHTHHPNIGKFAGKKCYTTGSLSFIGWDCADKVVNFTEQPSMMLFQYDNQLSCTLIQSKKQKQLGSVRL